MKIIFNYYKINFFILSLLLCACSSSDITYKVTSLSFEADGYINVEIWDINKGKSYEPEQALKDAVYDLLYFGIPSNNNFVAQKPLLYTQENRENFKKIEANFFDKDGDWSKFVRLSSTQTADSQSRDSKDLKSYRVSIAKDLLRKYLEEQKIINPLTTGF